MKVSTASFLFVLATLVSAVNAAVTFDWATVGNPGNLGDRQYVQGQGSFGAVNYVYRISKHEVTNAQYTEFLNAIDPMGSKPNLGGSDPFLYTHFMFTNANGGINFNGGAANGSKYQVKPGRDNNPVTFVSFFDAMRFTNWLQNGQGSGSTESGVYTIGSGYSEIRNPSATYFIPSEDEWYKAAYHKNDGVTANYWRFPTSTHATPYSDQPPGSGSPTQSNTMNSRNDDGIANGYDDGYAVTGSTSTSSTQNYLTDVGAYTASLSPYGTFDQGGNVLEWNEAAIFQSSFSRGLRGGNWTCSSSCSIASPPLYSYTGTESEVIGFRVASAVPEPSTNLLVAFATLGLMIWRRRLG
ncbi:SUMF1/EgtB/PvdO family nonheme iron enzyme [Bythopirellula polymerisocia]|uniref:Formylglycine-generating sulfatase enzyme n=1 Tax=Bythopirellula polymerisocia TaxID=2528003 RepID=A0A5C6D0Y2_9BACT|nr:SUMF1/EgtB/PvdO family nonheme iron enzyme [Bythopirellula polymerisocia]TWU29484.1 Formylglycine-generating sulfatase enzyme [Bythopirellula polymerisocia]